MDELSVLQRLGPKACLSHQTAARRWAIELLDGEGNHVTVPRERSRVQVAGWQVHRAGIGVGEVVDIHGCRLTTPLRTVLDLARILPHADAVVAADSALRQSMFSLAMLVSSTVAVVGRGASRIRVLPAAVDPLCGSVLESLLRVLLVSHGLVPTYTQYRVFNGFHFVGRVDFAWPHARLIVEVDGFAYHADRASYRRDRERDNELERLGWQVLRFTWEDVVGRPEYVVTLVSEVLARAA